MKRYQLLHKLYQQRFLGYEFIDDIEEVNDQNEIDDIHNISSLENLKKIVSSCHLCQLSKTRKNIVFGEGNPKATLMFVGEAPGAMEDEQGRPFVGRAGQLLTKIINNVLQLKREEVYIANIVKCRPPNNATPSLEIATTCKPYVLKQIELIKPKIIVALGSVAYKYLTNDLNAKITKVRGSIIDFKGIKLIPTYHPSYLLRNPSAKKDVFIDMKIVKALL